MPDGGRQPAHPVRPRLGLGHLLLSATALYKLKQEGEWTSTRVKGFQVERFVIGHTERPITEAMSGFMKILDGELAVLAKRGIVN